MTCDEQLELWVKGESVHNDERDECCPDFSCCQPDLLQPPEVRQAFAAADDKKRHEFLMTFLGGAVAKLPAKVHIAGTDPNSS